MPLTASFSDVRRDLTAITDEVIKNHVQVTVFKHNKPVFKIVPIEQDPQADYLEAAAGFSDEYRDVFEKLAR